jgi:hypothetical protein
MSDKYNYDGDEEEDEKEAENEYDGDEEEDEKEAENEYDEEEEREEYETLDADDVHDPNSDNNAECACLCKECVYKVKVPKSTMDKCCQIS